MQSISALLLLFGKIIKKQVKYSKITIKNKKILCFVQKKLDYTMNK